MQPLRVPIALERCLAAGLLALALPAQTSPTAAAAPAPVIRIEARGPAVFRQQLLPTNLGSMIASEAGEALWKDVLAAIDAHWQQLHGDAATFTVARRRILDYAGNLHLQFWLHDGEPETLSLVADPDGRTDMAAAARDLQRLVASATGEAWQQQTLGGRAMQQLTSAAEGTFVLDVLADGRVLFAAGQHQDAVAAAIARTLAAPASARAAGPLFDMQLDLAQMVRLADDDEQQAQSFRALGFASLRTLEFTLAPRGPQVQFELALTCAGDRGLFAGLFPEQAGVPALIGLAPADALGSKTSRFDAMVLWRTLIATIAADGQQTAAEVEAEASATVGVDLGKDVMPHLNGEALLVWDAPPEAAAEGSDNAPLLSLVVGLGDGKAFAAGFQKLLQKAEMNPEVEDGVLRAGKGQEWFVPEIHFGVAGDLAVMTVGPGAEGRVDAILARRQQPNPAPKALAQRQQAQPPGCNGAGVLAVDTCLRHYVGMIFDILGEVLPATPDVGPESVKPLIAQFLPLLQKQNLDQLVVFTGTANGRWALRLLW